MDEIFTYIYKKNKHMQVNIPYMEHMGIVQTSLLGGSSHLGYVVNHHGDRFRPLGLWDPFQMAFSWLIDGGDPNCFQVLG